MNWLPEPTDPPLSIGALTQQIKRLLEGSIGDVWVRGEISNLRRQSSGHLYFTLKDSEAQVSAVIFRHDADKLDVAIDEGMAVLAYGRLTVYAPRGNYQLIVRVASPEGEGDLRRRFEALKAKLTAEGLFSRDRKRPLPRLPRTLAVITSPTGAALRDFLSIVERRSWRGTVRILPVRVQGAEATPEIAAMVAYANQHALGDVIVLTRGGGSLEDLWPFNEEAVARAVAASELPVVSAVGHEIDFSLSDFAADVRAETPSAAAELLTSDFLEFAESVARLRRRLGQTVQQRMTHQRLHLRALHEQLRSNTPRHRVEQAWLRLDELTTRRLGLWERTSARYSKALTDLRHRLATVDPSERLSRAQEHLHHLAIRLRQASPEATLQRGYAMVRDAKGHLITRRSGLKPHSSIIVEWADGRAPFGPPTASKNAQMDLPLGN